MSRCLSALLSWLSSFAVAYLVGSTIKDRRTGLAAGLVSATVAAAVSWLAYGVAEAAGGRQIGDSA